MLRSRIARLLAALIVPILRSALKKYAPDFERRVVASIYRGLKRYITIKTTIVTVAFTIAASFLGVVQGLEETAGAIQREVQGDDLVGELAGVIYAGLLLGILAFYCYRSIPSWWRFVFGGGLGIGCVVLLVMTVWTVAGDKTGFYGSHPRFWFNTLSPVVYTALSLLTTWAIAKPKTSTRVASTTRAAASPTITPTPPPVATSEAQKIEGVA